MNNSTTLFLLKEINRVRRCKLIDKTTVIVFFDTVNDPSFQIRKRL